MNQHQIWTILCWFAFSLTRHSGSGSILIPLVQISNTFISKLIPLKFVCLFFFKVFGKNYILWLNKYYDPEVWKDGITYRSIAVEQLIVRIQFLQWGNRVVFVGNETHYLSFSMKFIASLHVNLHFDQWPVFYLETLYNYRANEVMLYYISSTSHKINEKLQHVTTILQTAILPIWILICRALII